MSVAPSILPEVGRGYVVTPGFMLPLREGKKHPYITKTVHVTCQPKMQRQPESLNCFGDGQLLRLGLASRDTARSRGYVWKCKRSRHPHGARFRNLVIN